MAKKQLLMVETREEGTAVVIKGSFDDVLKMYGNASCGVLKAFNESMGNFDNDDERASCVLKTMLAGVIGGVAEVFAEDEIDADLKPAFRKALEETLPTMREDIAFFFKDKSKEEANDENEDCKKIREIQDKAMSLSAKGDLIGALAQLLEFNKLISSYKEKHSKESTK